MSFCLNLWIKEFCNAYFTKLLNDHRIPPNIDFNERLRTGRFGANGINNFNLYVGIGSYF